MQQRRQALDLDVRHRRAEPDSVASPSSSWMPACERLDLVVVERLPQPERVLALDAEARMEDRSAQAPSFVSRSRPSESWSSRPTG